MSLLGTSDARRQGAQRPPLRLLRGGSRAAHEGERAKPEAPVASAQRDARGAVPSAAGEAPVHATAERSRILVAGADPARRAAVLRDLSEALPDDTQFGEAGAAWEVLEQAPSSGVVMLAGDLDEVTAESLMHVLGHRHPSLPVVALGLFADRGPAHGGHSPRAASAAG
jgi:hypothetical protein